MQEDLNISAANLQWPISVYSLTYGYFLLLSGKFRQANLYTSRWHSTGSLVLGRLADIFGRKLLFLVGTVWLGVMFVQRNVQICGQADRVH
jgi:MFS family permease